MGAGLGTEDHKEDCILPSSTKTEKGERPLWKGKVQTVAPSGSHSSSGSARLFSGETEARKRRWTNLSQVFHRSILPKAAVNARCENHVRLHWRKATKAQTAVTESMHMQDVQKQTRSGQCRTSEERTPQRRMLGVDLIAEMEVVRHVRLKRTTGASFDQEDAVELALPRSN